MRTCSDARAQSHLQISHLEGEPGKLPIIKRNIAKDQIVTCDDVEFPDIKFHRLLARQAEIS